jgi:hypothetical protein
MPNPFLGLGFNSWSTKYSRGSASSGGATDNNKIVVGAYNSGSVYVYDSDGTNEAKISASDGASGDSFGISVAVGSNKIVVGAYGDDDNGSNSGSVYVYDLDGTNEIKITASDGAAVDRFGGSVAVGSNKIVVGSKFDDDDGSSSGSVYVYDLDGTNEVKITASDAAGSDQFGTSVAVANNKIVVGSPLDDDDGSSSGSAYIYNLDGTGEIKITASDAAVEDLFGTSVAVGSNKIVVGARQDDDDGSFSGSAYIYNLDGTGEVKITASDAASGDRFGGSVAVGSNKIVVAAHNADVGGNSNQGAVYIYNLDGTNEIKITASDGVADLAFGTSVAVGSNKIVVGTPFDDDDGPYSGAVYIYNLDGTGEIKLTASDGASGYVYGSSVSIG